MSQNTSRVGKRGTMVIPAALRRRFGIEEGSLVIAEAREEGILIRPAIALPLESYTPREEHSSCSQTRWMHRITPVPKRRFAGWGLNPPPSHIISPRPLRGLCGPGLFRR